MTRPGGAEEIAGLHVRFVEVHGEARARRAYLLAWLKCSNDALALAVAESARAERRFSRAWAEEEERWTEIRAREAADPALPKKLRPPWGAATWRELERLSRSRAQVEEWFAFVGDLALQVARAPAAPRKKAIVMYGNDGEPRTWFVEEERRNDDEG